MSKYYFFITLLSFLVIVVVVLALAVSGTPITLQNITADSNRQSNFGSISYSIDTYYNKNQKLPAQLADLGLSSATLMDYTSQKAYQYNITGTTSYTLCSDFAVDSAEMTKAIGAGYGSDKFVHKKGYDCIPYTVTVQPSPTPQVVNNPVVPVANVETITGTFNGISAASNGEAVMELNVGTGRTYFYFQNSPTFNKSGATVFVSNYFSVGDQVSVEATKTDTNYTAVKIQNLTR